MSARKENPTFQLYRSTSKSNRCEYVGCIRIGTMVYAIEANVVEHDGGDGTRGKHFEGQVHGGQELVRSMLKGAKVNGKIPKDWQDLVDSANQQATDTPFDDALPEGMGIGTTTGGGGVT